MNSEETPVEIYILRVPLTEEKEDLFLRDVSHEEVSLKVSRIRKNG